MIKYGATSDDHIGLTLQDGLKQLGNVLPAVLIVGIGVNYDVSAMCDRVLYARGEGFTQAPMAAQAEYMINA